MQIHHQNALLMRRNMRVWEQLITKIAKRHQLTFMEWTTLMNIFHAKNKRIAHGELAQQLFFNNNDLSVVVKKLESKKFIIKTIKKDDQRVKILSINKKKEKLIKEMADLDKQIYRAWFNCLDKKANETFNLSLEKTYNNIEMLYIDFL